MDIYIRLCREKIRQPYQWIPRRPAFNGSPFLLLYRSYTNSGGSIKSNHRIPDFIFSNRNISAYIGYEAVEVLQEFIDKYPDKSKSLNFTQRDVVFTNFYYSEVEREARRDNNIIRHFCGNKTNKG